MTVVLGDVEFGFSEDGIRFSLGASNDSQVEFLFLDFLIIVNIELGDQSELMMESNRELRLSVNLVRSDVLVVSLALNDKCVALRGCFSVQ